MPSAGSGFAQAGCIECHKVFVVESDTAYDRRRFEANDELTIRRKGHHVDIVGREPHVTSIEVQLKRSSRCATKRSWNKANNVFVFDRTDAGETCCRIEAEQKRAVRQRMYPVQVTRDSNVFSIKVQRERLTGCVILDDVVVLEPAQTIPCRAQQDLWRRLAQDDVKANRCTSTVGIQPSQRDTLRANRLTGCIP